MTYLKELAIPLTAPSDDGSFATLVCCTFLSGSVLLVLDLRWYILILVDTIKPRLGMQLLLLDFPTLEHLVLKDSFWQLSLSQRFWNLLFHFRLITVT